MSSVVLDSTNPQDIILNFTIPSYPEVMSIPFGSLDQYALETMQRAIVQGVSIGSCGALFLILLITNAHKKKTPAFFLNTSVLFIAIIRAGIYINYLMGPLDTLSFAFTGIVMSSDYRSVQVVTAADSIYVLFILLVEMSMTYQIYVVFKSPEVRRLGITVTVISASFAVCVVGLYMFIAVHDNSTFYDLAHTGEVEIDTRVQWISNLGPIFLFASVNLLNFFLLVKLIFAIRTRRFLGLKQFDSLHILVIASTQTMIIPSIIALVNYGVDYLQTPAMFQMQVLLVVLSLPLSSVWAQAANNSPMLPSTMFSFLNRTSSRSSNEDTSTLVSNAYSLFPHKLSRPSTAETRVQEEQKFGPVLYDRNTTFIGVKAPSSGSVTMMPGLEAILNDTNSSISCDDEVKTGFISVTQHHVNR